MYQRHRNKLIIEFLWDTGARVGEVAGVRIIDIHHTAPKGYFDKSYTKRNKTRPFFLNEGLHA